MGAIISVEMIKPGKQPVNIAVYTLARWICIESAEQGCPKYNHVCLGWCSIFDVCLFAVAIIAMNCQGWSCTKWTANLSGAAIWLVLRKNRYNNIRCLGSTWHWYILCSRPQITHCWNRMTGTLQLGQAATKAEDMLLPGEKQAHSPSSVCSLRTRGACLPQSCVWKNWTSSLY